MRGKKPGNGFFYEKTLEERITESIDIAKDLMYDDRIIAKIRRAKSERELDLILAEARRNL